MSCCRCMKILATGIQNGWCWIGKLGATQRGETSARLQRGGLGVESGLCMRMKPHTELVGPLMLSFIY